MKKVCQEIVLGETCRTLQVFDIDNFKITHTQEFEQANQIIDILAIDDSNQLLLAGYKGVLKATKDQALKHYFKGKAAWSLCHIAQSLYLVGFIFDGLIVWDENTDQQVLEICQDYVISIKRILTTNSYIIKTKNNGLKLLTIKNLKNS